MECGLLVLGDHLPNPHTGERLSQAERHRQIVELAVRGEEIGLGSVWLGEHHGCDYILSSPPVVLAAIAERTRRMRLGTGVTLLGTLDPLRAAEDYATVDVLSGGRVEVVAGRGVLRRTYADFGLDPDRSREAFEEKVELLLRLWREEDVRSDGRHRAPLAGVTAQPRPLQRPHPPVWIGGGSSFDSIDLAARLGLALMLPSVLGPPEAFVLHVERYRERFVPGPAGGAPRVGACSHVHVARDGRAARARWEPYHMGYIRWVLLELMPWGGLNIGPSGLRPPPPTAAPDFETLCRGPSICGSPAEVADRIGAIRERLGVDLHIAMFDHGGIPEPELQDALELYGKEVLPQLAP
jgi:alkanesulfonate monooxygenase SsuD/methylene tetrahydromethanopterin reductase-like flavin-dependent oxidoreductase (luciferase family)